MFFLSRSVSLNPRFTSFIASIHYSLVRENYRETPPEQLSHETFPCISTPCCQKIQCKIGSININDQSYLQFFFKIAGQFWVKRRPQKLITCVRKMQRNLFSIFYLKDNTFQLYCLWEKIVIKRKNKIFKKSTFKKCWCSIKMQMRMTWFFF